MQRHTEFKKFALLPLPYGYKDLEPYIDEETLRIHHDRLLKKYIDNLNQLIMECPQMQNQSLPNLLKNCSRYPQSVQRSLKNNAGGVYNHNFYFEIMTPNAPKEAVGNLRMLITRNFGSFANFKQEFSTIALEQFGSGWTWLTLTNCNKLKIITTPNHDTPLTLNLRPLLLIDIWEHAYFLQYKNRREEYIKNWFNIINWNKIEMILRNYIKRL